MDLPAILAVIGGIALLVGILGGGVEAKELKIRSITKQTRNLSMISGVVLIGLSIITYIFRPSSPQEGSSSTSSATQTSNTPADAANAQLTETSASTIPANSSTVTWEMVYKSPKIARKGMSAVFDNERQVIVMFGGVGLDTTNDEIMLNETWEYEGNSWYQVNTAIAPPPRKWFGMAYDFDRKITLLFGGNQNQTLINDTWEYDGINWKLVQPASNPPPLDAFGFVYDTCRKRAVLYGGNDVNGFSRNTWEYDGKSWVEIKTFVSPPARSLFSMVFDNNRCRTVLFGGGGENFIARNDTWEYDGSNWVEIKTNISPSPRWGHSMVFNPINGNVFLFGGYGPQWPDGNESLDTWTFDGTQWIELQPENSPGFRQQTILAFDGNSNAIILFGGNADGETWKLVER